MTPESLYRPTFARVSLDAVLSNYAHLKTLARGAMVCPVVKADAYGHGAVAVSRALEREGGCSLFAVGNVDEALELRAGGITSELLVLFGAGCGDAPTMAKNGLTPVVGSLDILRRLGEEAKASGTNLGVHLKFDTGMARLGLETKEAAEAARIIKNCPFLSLKGVSTHFARAGDNSGFTGLQLERLKEALGALNEAGLEVGFVHAANSAALMAEPESVFNCVRAGIALYGVRPESWLDPEGRLKPALEWVSAVMGVRRVDAGVPVSYGGTFVTKRPSVIGAAPVGYADGYRRSLGNRAEVLVRGRRCPVVGRVCMDLIMFDLTEIKDAAVGDEVILLGRQENEAITAEELAGLQETIPYEVLTSISGRVLRKYT